MNKMLFIKTLSTSSYKTNKDDYEKVHFNTYSIINIDSIVAIEPNSWYYNKETMTATDLSSYRIYLNNDPHNCHIDISPEEYEKLCNIFKEQENCIIL